MSPDVYASIPRSIQVVCGPRPSLARFVVTRGKACYYSINSCELMREDPLVAPVTPFTPNGPTARAPASGASSTGSSIRARCQRWRNILCLGSSQVVRPGVLLVGAPEPRCLYLLDSGIAKITRTDSEGNTVLLGLRFPGNLIGTTPLLLSSLYVHAEISATECRVLEVPTTKALAAFRSNADAAYLLAQQHAREALSVCNQLLDARLSRGEQRFFRILTQLASATRVSSVRASWISVKMPINDCELAELVGLHPCSFSRLKRSLITRGDLLKQDSVLSFPRHRLISPDDSDTV